MRNRTDGATLVLFALFCAVLLAGVFTATAQLVLLSKKLVTDHRASLQAQYAAESGVARQQAAMITAVSVLNNGAIDQNISTPQLMSLFSTYCGTLVAAPFLLPSPSGSVLCTAGPAANPAATLTAIVPTSAYPAGWSSADWGALFSAAGRTQAASPGDTRYVSAVRLVPVGVTQLATDSYTLDVQLVDLTSQGDGTGQQNATRRLDLDRSNTVFHIGVLRPAFSKYAQFRNKTTNTSGQALYFGDGESFNGPVHTNAPLRLANFNNRGVGGPQFYDKVTTSSSLSSADLSGALPCTRASIGAGSCSVMFPNIKPVFSVPTIPLPNNNNNQQRAVFSGDAGNSAPMSNTELNLALGINTLSPLNTPPNGVYFSKGNGSAPNASPSLLGGLYIQGAANVTLSTTGTPGRQVITVVQGTTTTLFEQGATGSWTVKVGAAAPVTLGGSFNGMIYGSAALNISGDGTAAPDIASGSRVTVSNANGDMIIKNSLTYTDNPLTNPSAVNVLGLYAASGSVLLDGPNNQALDVQGTILASANGEGFGTVNPSAVRANPTPAINLLGGVIEDQSQTVSSGTGGYSRKFTYDPRFRQGYAPPFFPLQQRWEVAPDDGFTLGTWRQAQ